jgi:outer membrane protein assembly factor BamB
MDPDAIPGVVCAPLPEDCGEGTGLEPGAPWPTLGRCPKLQSRSPFAAPRHPLEKWKATLGGYVNARPALSAGGTLYIGAGDGKLYAIDSRTGDVHWTADIGAEIYWASPTIAKDGTIYIGSQDLVAVAPDGTERWRFRAPDPCITPPRVESTAVVGPDGTIFIGASCSMYALDPTNGAVKWSYDLAMTIESTPSLGDDGTLFVAARGVVALEAKTGAKRWAWMPTHKVGWASPTLDDHGMLFVGSLDDDFGAPGDSGRLIYGIEAATLATKWTFETASDWIYSTPAIGCDGTVLVGADDHRLYALDPERGLSKWSYETPGMVWSSPTVDAHGVVYLGTRGGTVVALDPRDGSTRWSYETGATDITSSVVIGRDGSLYVATLDGTVFAFGAPEAAH